MNILLALHQFPPFGGGGTELLAQWMTEGLRAMGHGVRLVSAIPRRDAIEGLVPPAGHEAQFLPPPAWPADDTERIRREYDDPAAGAAFGALLDKHRPDLVHFLHLAGLTASALRAVTGRGIPAIFTATDFWFECPTVQLLLCDHSRCEGPAPGRLNCARHLMEIRHPELSFPLRLSALDRPAAAALNLAARAPVLQRMTARFDALAGRSPALKSALTSARAVIAPTTHMRERLARFGISEGRLHLVRYGVPPPKAAHAQPGHLDQPPKTGSRSTSIASRHLCIGYIGTLAAHKGPHLLVEALGLLRDVEVTADFHGDIDDSDYCLRLRAAARSDARIRLQGRFVADDIGVVLDAIDVLVIPSLWDENAPLVLLQAIAYRCPVLVSNVPGLVEAMRGDRDGWTFERNDARDLALALQRLAADGAPLARVRGERTAIHSIDDHLRDLLGVYEKCGARALRTQSR